MSSKIKNTIETMRKVVNAYDNLSDKLNSAKLKYESAKDKIKSVTEDERVMKFGTVIGIVVGALTLIAAGAAAAYFFFKCKEKCLEEAEDELYDDFPEEEIITDEGEDIPEDIPEEE